MTSSLSCGQDVVKSVRELLATVPRTEQVQGLVLFLWLQCDCYHYQCCITKSTNLVAKNQPFCYAHGFYGSGIQKGQRLISVP